MKALTFALAMVSMPVAAEQPTQLTDTVNDMVRGVVQPKEEVVLSSTLTAKITKMPYREGQRFKRGATLVQFDCARTRAEANAASAAYIANKAKFQSAKELDIFNAVGKDEVEISRAEMNRAAAEAKALRLQTHECVVAAPFSGKVSEAMVRQYQTPQANQELMKIINDSVLELHLIIPSKWLAWVKTGTKFSFRVDETGNEYAARITQLGAEVDAVSQTIKVVGKLANRSGDVLPGMSGTASFPEAADYAPALNVGSAR